MFVGNKTLMSLSMCEPEVLLAQPDPCYEDIEIRTMSAITLLIDRELTGTIGWAKMVPGKSNKVRSDNICTHFSLEN